MNLRVLVSTLLLAVLLARGAGAQQAHAKLYHRVEGADVRVALEIRIAPGWHLYHTELGPPDAIGQPTRVVLEAEGVQWGAVRFPEPERYDQEIGNADRPTWVLGHEGTIVVYSRGTLSGAPPASVGATIAGQTCSESCIPYRQTLTSAGAGPDTLFARFPADLPGPGDASGGVPSATDPGAEAALVPAGKLSDADYASWEWKFDFTAREEVVERGLGTWLLLALLAGLLLNVMPCVLPVISIKVLSFVQQAGESRQRVLALGLAFAAGILVVFEVLALIAWRAGAAWGQQFQSQEFLIVMIGLVFAFALSLFGVFELGVPSSVGGLAGRNREGLADAFAKGMLATVLATPCSGPFLGSTLTWTLSQPAGTIFAVFTMLGLGMAAPYVLLTANPAFLKLLPKPGAWMETFKQAMGFLLLATVIYLMISLKQDLLLFTVAALVFVGMGCWWWGRFASFEHGPGRRLAVLCTALSIAAGGAWLSFGPFQGLFEEQPGHIAWVDFEPDVLESLLDSEQSVFVDFTADWCPNCKYNEFFVFETDEIRGLLKEKGVVALRADITHDSPKTARIEDLMDRLGSKSIPFLAVFPADDPSRPYTRRDVVTVAEMREVLEALPGPRTAGDQTAKRIQ